MLIDDPAALAADPILNMVATVNGSEPSRRIRQGIYQIGHFGGSYFMAHLEHYPNIEIGDFGPCCYGVCDSPEQLLATCPELESSPRRFVVSMNRLLKARMHPEGGWRWHKWGPYIGEQKPECEYLFDEPTIEEVWTFHIYEAK